MSGGLGDTISGRGGETCDLPKGWTVPIIQHHWFTLAAGDGGCSPKISGGPQGSISLLRGLGSGHERTSPTATSLYDKTFLKGPHPDAPAI